MTDGTIFTFEEQNLRLDTQEGVCGIIPDGQTQAALVALYLRLGDHDREKVYEKIKERLKATVISEFVTVMMRVADQITHPTPEGNIEL